MTLTELVARASPDASRLAREVLEADISNQRWTRQLGPVLTQRDAARLLGKSEQAVAKDRRLLRIRNRDGRPVYPVFQFAGRGQVSGVAEVVRTLSPTLEALTIASWLTAPNPSLEGRRPINALRDGDQADVASVATRLARTSG